MKWKPTAIEKDWIRKEAGEKAGMLQGQVTLDAIIDGSPVPWAEFVRVGLDLSTSKSVTFDVFEMQGFAQTRKRGDKRATLTVHVKNSRPPEVVYIT